MSTQSKRRILPADPVAVLVRLTVACVAAIGLLLGARGQAQAQAAAPQAPCGSHAEISGKLADRFSEAATGIGLTSKGNVIEIFTSGDGETWSIVMTRPDGTSCLMASGSAWEAIELDSSPQGPQA